MMQHSNRPMRFRTTLSALVTGLCMVVLPSCGEAARAGHHPRVAAHRDSLLCKQASMPLSAKNSEHGHRLVLQLGDGRFFAPTRSAMFFSHPGDRCAWHGSVAARS